MSYQYRLKKGARSHQGQDEWNFCTSEQKTRIEKTSPNRFEFKESIKSEVPPAAIVKPKATKAKKKAEDK